MQAFFLAKFQFDFEANQKWITSIEEQDVFMETSIRSQMCHILNVHHLWVSRLNKVEVISDDWDDLPFYAWGKLNEENYRQTQMFIEYQDIRAAIPYTNSEGDSCLKMADDILYHILQHSTHHRSQINAQLRKIGLIPVEYNFIAWDKL